MKIEITKKTLALIIGGLILVFYGSTLFNGFIQDDVGQVETNVYIRSLRYLPKTVTSCIWESANKNCYGNSFYYRPLHFLSYILTYQISSRPWAFHLLNLVYLFLVGFCVFLLANALTGDLQFSLISSVIVVIHPINSEVANWIATVPELLYTIFTCLATYFHVRFRKGEMRSYLPVYLFYVAAIFSKEPAILLPIVLLAIDIFVLKASFSDRKERTRYFYFLLPFFIYFLMRKTVLGNTDFFGGLSLSERIYSFVVLLGQYVLKVFLPHPLNGFYNFEIDSLFSWKFFLSFVALAGCAFLVFYFWKKGKGILSLSIIWFFAFLSPVVVFLNVVGQHVFSERYVFCSSVGFSFIVSYFLCRVIKNNRLRYIFLSFLIIISFLLVFFRNRDWKDNETFYEVTLRQNPYAHILRYQLGDIYLKKGELEKARVEFEKIIELDSQWKDITMAYKGLGDYFRLTRQFELAEVNYQKAIETSGLRPRDYVTLNDLGTVYLDEEKYLLALSSFCQALSLYSESQTVNENFNETLSLIDSDYKKEGLLFQKITEEFRVKEDNNIVFQDKDCQDGKCHYQFSLRENQPELIFSFFISAIDGNNNEVVLENPSFNGTTMNLDGPDKIVKFAFPTCNREYYLVEMVNK